MRLEDEPRPLGVEVLRPDGETVRLKTENAGRAGDEGRAGGVSLRDEGERSEKSEKSEKPVRGQVFRYADTYEIGIYTLRLMDAVHSPQIAYAINFDPEEADPTKIERQALEERLRPALVVFADNPEDLSGTFAALREGRSLWTPLLAAVLAVMLLDTFISNRLTSRPG